MGDDDAKWDRLFTGMDKQQETLGAHVVWSREQLAEIRTDQKHAKEAQEKTSEKTTTLFGKLEATGNKVTEIDTKLDAHMVDTSAHEAPSDGGGNAKIWVAAIGAITTIGGLVTAYFLTSGGS